VKNRFVPIGKLFDLEKGQLQSTKCTPGEFDFITAAEDWKTHRDYTHECEALIFAAAASGSLGRTHYVNGKFVTSDLCFIMTPKDEAKYPLNLAFYHFVLNSLRSILVAATKAGTSKESINQTNFKNYEIPYFDIERQDLWIEKLKSTLGKKELLGAELAHQQTLLKKLRQQILQEAIEGKLTADWRAENPDLEPASKLLKRIAAEKTQLIKDKKIKAQKPLPPITEEEKQFELPDNWVWCRLDNIIDNLLGGYAFQSPLFKKTGNKQVLRLGNIRPYIVRIDENPVFVDEDVASEASNAKLKSGDLLITMTGTRGKRDYCYSVLLKNEHFQDRDLYLNQRVGCIRFNRNISLDYYDYCLKSDDLLYQIFSTATGAANQANIGSNALRSWIVPLPPLSEQIIIVAKVEKLLALCDQLEAQITQNQSHAEQLMQAVLKEAFSRSGNPQDAATTLEAVNA